MEDTLGDHLKSLERSAQPTALSSTLPIYVRIDGRGFSRFTKGMSRPFDMRMTAAMTHTANTLVEKTHAVAAYVQSDEISLIWKPNPDGEAFFGGKPFKITSVLAGLATAAFTQVLMQDKSGLAAYADRMPHFDARVVQTSRIEAASFLTWRGQDARRNAVSQIARAHFSHRELQGKSSQTMQAMMAEIGVRPDDFHPACLNGTLMLRRTRSRTLSELEMARIPLAHRPAPDSLFQRGTILHHTKTHPGQMQDLDQILFDGKDPL